MGDLISKQAALDALEWKWAGKAAIDAIKNLPPVLTIDPVKHGKWIPHPTEPDWDVCSVCGTGTMRRTHGYNNGAFWDAEESYLYCPWCGARMSEANDEAD